MTKIHCKFREHVYERLFVLYGIVIEHKLRKIEDFHWNILYREISKNNLDRSNLLTIR